MSFCSSIETWIEKSGRKQKVIFVNVTQLYSKFALFWMENVFYIVLIKYMIWIIYSGQFAYSLSQFVSDIYTFLSCVVSLDSIVWMLARWLQGALVKRCGSDFMTWICFLATFILERFLFMQQIHILSYQLSS